MAGWTEEVLRKLTSFVNVLGRGRVPELARPLSGGATCVEKLVCRNARPFSVQEGCARDQAFAVGVWGCDDGAPCFGNALMVHASARSRQALFCMTFAFVESRRASIVSVRSRARLAARVGLPIGDKKWMNRSRLYDSIAKVELVVLSTFVGRGGRAHMLVLRPKTRQGYSKSTSA